MKVAKVELKWYTIRYDMNKKKIKYYNVLGGNFKEEIAKKIRKKAITNLKELKHYIDVDFRYHFWCKCECELSIGQAFEDDVNKLEKIDIYYQLEPNLDRIVEYINSAMKLNLR